MGQQGFYKDPPSRRMAYDADGSIMVFVSAQNTVTQYGDSIKQYFNSDDESLSVPSEANTNQNPGWFTFIFPENRDVSHVFLNGYYPPSFGGTTRHVAVHWSTNTTSGLDGDWNSAGIILAPVVPTNPYFRDPLSMGLTAVKAIRFQYGELGPGQSGTIGKIHIWGLKSPGETPHRIDFAYSDGNELVQDEDYGDQPRDSTRTWGPIDGFNIGTPLYLKNKSPDKVANDVHLTCGALTGGMASDVTLSKDNSSYSTTLIWTEIQPLELVGPVYVRHITADNEALGVRDARLKVVVGSWV